LSEFRAELSEKAFNEKVHAFENTINKLDKAHISKFETRKILNCLTVISGSAERSIKEYIALGSEEKVNKLYGGTANVFASALVVLSGAALKEAELNQQKFERRIASIQRSHQLNESYSDLKSSFRIRKKDE
jgi:hypothetical protein